MRKIVISGLVATAALLGCAGPVLAGTGITGTTGPATATAGGKSAETAFLQAIAAKYPASSAARRLATSLQRLTAVRPQASATTQDVTAGIAISCASPTACLSVGIHAVESSTSQSITPFAARLHAGTWKAVPVKMPKGARFAIPLGVSCKTATNCLVVGEALTNSAPGIAPFAQAWNGTTLTPIAAPPLPAHTMGAATSVSCVAASSCVAIGSGANVTTDADTQIVWTWNGTKWARTTVPDADPSTNTGFSGLRCFSLTSCVATGSVDATSSTGTITPVAAAWNGTAFTDLRAALPAGVGDPVFNGLSCVSPHNCVVVGSGNSGSTGIPSLAFAEVWNGKTWAVTKWGGPKGDTQAELIAVSCTSAVHCIAVGDHGTAKAGAPAALAWTGSKWAVLKVAGAGAGKAAVFGSISCPVNGKCVTTGVLGKADLSVGTPLGGYWNGSTWKYGPMLSTTAT